MGFVIRHNDSGSEIGFDRLAKTIEVTQAESESSLINKRLKKIVTANNIVKFARKAAPVAA